MIKRLVMLSRHLSHDHELGRPGDLDGRIKPQGLFASLSRHLPDNAVLSADSGTSADWYARHVRIRSGMKASLSGNLATMGPGVQLDVTPFNAKAA